MKNYSFYNKIFLACMLLLPFSCSRKADDFKDLLEGKELIYPGKVENVVVSPGNGRLQLQWAPSPDPHVVRYVINWNNGRDSLVINSASHNTTDTVRYTINNLAEYNYSFNIYSYDDEGNRSVVTEVNNAHSYGSIYRAGLYNRLPDASKIYTLNTDGSVTLYFTTPDTINISTKIAYVNSAGQNAVAELKPDQSSITLPSIKFGGTVTYQSSYIPVRNAIDTFLTNAPDTLPPIYGFCDKSLFAVYNMWGDMSWYETSVGTPRLWDGSTGPQGWPNIFHSGGGAVPGTFSFDMGKVYKLLDVEETGRDCCHNPLEFEVWGIEDITNAVPPVNPTDGSWATEMTNKGWTMLTKAVRNDDGKAAKLFSFDTNIPPVRYIRMRVLKTATTDGYVNLSELTFRYKD